MPKPEALSVPNNTNMTSHTSYHPLPVSHIKQHKNMHAVDRSEKVFALPSGIFLFIPTSINIKKILRTLQFNFYH